MTPNPHAWLLTDLQHVPANGLRVMSTFACGGGSTMGYKRAGFSVIAANDIDPVMAKHYQQNLHPQHYFLAPIRDLLTAELPPECFALDILDGSPPCSSFSMAGNREKDWGKHKHFREGQAKQVLDDLFFDFIDVAERLQPRVIVAENVKGLTIGKAKGYLKLICQRLRDIGYVPQVFLLNAADCSVPQRRVRVFIIAHRRDFAVLPLKLSARLPHVTARESTADLGPLTLDEREETSASASNVRWWPFVKPGQSLKNAVPNGQSLFNQCRLSGDDVSLTLTAQHQKYLHWDECRNLTLREFIRIGSFPDDYQCDTPAIGKYIIGMSVPPKMMEVVARAVAAQWFGVHLPTKEPDL